MTPSGVHRDDMFNDDPTIAAFARDLQAAAASTPAPAVGVTLASVLSGQAPTVAYPEVHAPHSRGRVVRRSARARWAVAGTVFGLGAGSLGIAGALPAPVQRQVARMAEIVGVDLPDGQDSPTTTITVPEPATTTTVPTTTSTTLPTSTTVGPVIAGDDGSVATTSTSREDDNSGHGNDDDGDDADNPGNGNGHGSADDGDEDQDEDDSSGPGGRDNASSDDERDDDSGPGGGNDPDDDNNREED